MSAETTLYATLSGAVGVTALVGTRVYPDFLSQEFSLPAVVYQRAGTEYINTISVPNIAQRVSMEIWCLDKSRIDADALADVVTSALATAAIYPQDRRPEFSPENETYASVIACDIWQQ